MNTWDKKPTKLITRGRGGVTAHYSDHHHSQGYGYHLAGYLGEELAPGCLLVDTTEISDDDIGTFAVRGPMIGVDLAPGLVSPCFAQARPWVCEGQSYQDPGALGLPDEARSVVAVAAHHAPLLGLAVLPGAQDPRLGNAGGLDTVSVDVYVSIARSFGARVMPADSDEARQLAAELG